MNWHRIQSNWQHFRTLARDRWAKLTLEDLDLIAGHREHLACHIQETYGISRDAAQMQIEAWQGQQREPAAT
jgi:uncharacterized protein YjbJ (UPF0337 family)